MIGLIKKDLLTLKKQLIIIIFFVAFYGILSFAQPGNYSMFAYMVTLYSIFIPMTSLGYDDRSEWNKYAITMPVTRKHLVYSKYLLSILAIGITGILCIVLILLIDKGFTSESLFTITSSLSIGVLFISIILPFNFRFGVEKSRFIIFGLFGIPTVLIVILSKANIPLPSEDFILKLLRFLPLLAVAVLIISNLVSVSIVEKKEY
ncbi:ABC-2 transporter permease [Lachnoclostridium phytofermentans]|uniref:Transporter protein n=1 Tax=Lachnoclostridium phytofermentans (strain ATCC 700394 / DSM 18823 / ISDg) TaxID=357809 RepID=A9KLA3_LACP7|nr:ABC-2 transporter permease [Lachnoclostridium phytofermentans]ABX44252.1 transporter protein [Lachnoclostridium phytofermentans ISDg]